MTTKEDNLGEKDVDIALEVFEGNNLRKSICIAVPNSCAAPVLVEQDLIDENEGLIEEELKKEGETEEEKELREVARKSFDLRVSLGTATRGRWGGHFPTFLCLTATMGFALMSLCVKLGGATIPSFELAWGRSVWQLIFATIFLWCQGVTKIFGSRKDVFPLLFRGILCFIGMVCYFYGVTKLPMSEAVPISFTGPVWVGIQAAIILGEKWHKIDMFGSFLCMIGVVFIAHPPFIFPTSPTASNVSDLSNMERYVAVGVTIFGASMSSAASVLTRKMGTSVHPLVQVNWFSIVSIVLGPIGLPFQPLVIPNWKEFFIIALVGFFGFFAQYLIQWAYQIERAGKIASLGYSQIVISVILEIIFLHNFPDLWAIAGMFLICGFAVISIAKDSEKVQEIMNRGCFVKNQKYNKVSLDEEKV